MIFFPCYCEFFKIVQYFSQPKDLLIAVLPFCIESGQGKSHGSDAVKGPIIGGPFTLIDMENRTITEKNFLGNWVLLYFGYTSSPDVGPEQVQTMAKAVDILGLSL